MHSAFLELSERTEFSDEYFAALGRAIYVAQQFEGKCRSISVLKGVRARPDSLDDVQFTRFVSKLWNKRLADHIAGLRGRGLPSQVEDVLDRARKARNYLAHLSALNIERAVETDRGRAKLLRELETHVHEIAEADFVVSLIIQAINKSDFPRLDFAKKYPDLVAEWVCRTAD